MDSKEILDKIVNYSTQIFENNLVGIYLHGSLAMGCYNPKKSDIDLLIVVEHEITNHQKERFLDLIVTYNSYAPAKGIEMSIVKEEHCRKFIYPTSYELHFSQMHLNWYKTNPKDYVENMKGTDPDLAAHFVIIKARGITLFGKDIKDLFGEVPSEAYLDSIKGDIAQAYKDILENPIYIILNLCRVLAYVQDRRVLSKKEGGEWGMRHLDERYQELIKEALECYLTGQDMIVERPYAIDFCSYMKSKIG